jgi:hypothetical protein
MPPNCRFQVPYNTRKGRHLEEEQLQTFFKCSELYHYGGTLAIDTTTQLIQETLERTLYKLISRPTKHWEKLLAFEASVVRRKLAKKHPELLQNELDSMIRATILWAYDFFKFFSPRNFHTVWGATPYLVKVAHTSIRLNISGVFKHKKNDTLHIVTYSPYVNIREAFSDPTTQLKLKTFQRFVKRLDSNAKSYLHIVGCTNSKKLYHSILNEKKNLANYSQSISTTILAIEYGFHHPTIPCPWKCQYKTKCFPSGDTIE